MSDKCPKCGLPAVNTHLAFQEWECGSQLEQYFDQTARCLVVELRREIARLKAENEINASDALRTLEFDLVLGQAIPIVVKYATERIAAIKAGDTEATLQAREANWQTCLDERDVEIARLRKFAEGIRDGYDHEEDAHRYRNGACRVCQAVEVLAKLGELT